MIFTQFYIKMGLVLSYKLALEYLPKLAALFIPLFIAMSPANIWFLAAYSDMTFLLLTIIAFYCLKLRCYWHFAVVGCLLALTRFTGFLIILPLIINYWRNRMWQKYQLINLFWQSLLVLSGLLLFMLILDITMGDPLAFYHIQSAWGHLSTSWFTSPWQSLVGTWHSGVGHDRLFVLLLPCWLALLLCYGYFEEASFGFISMLAPLAAGSLWSFSRYSLGLYPIYFALGLIARKNYLVGLAILLIATFISASYFTVWLNDGWV